MKKDEQKQGMALFQGKKVRKTIYQKEWWFSVVDVCEVLTGSSRPKKYWNDLRKKLENEGCNQPSDFSGPLKYEEDFQLSPNWGQLKLLAEDGKMRVTDCANTEGIFRIIQSIPSPKAEPFKRWLAKVGYERVREIENPELATKRTKLLYKLKGYSDEWIEQRVRGIEVREELTGEWQKRGASENKDFEILTAEISQATFGLKPNDHKKLKGLKKENLRDHMESLELILTTLAEATTKEIHISNDSKGVPRLKDDARVGGQIAGSTRKQIERTIGRSIVSKNNFLESKQKKELK